MTEVGDVALGDVAKRLRAAVGDDLACGQGSGGAEGVDPLLLLIKEGDAGAGLDAESALGRDDLIQTEQSLLAILTIYIDITPYVVNDEAAGNAGEDGQKAGQEHQDDFA